MNFCPSCGAKVSLRIPDGDNLPRYVCGDCSQIHYQNPKIVVGAIPVFGERILLARRAIEPRLGFWTLPAGFMENGETSGEAAIRETLEEACAEIELDRLFSVINIPHISQIHMFYLARLRTETFAAGVESLDVQLFAPASIPWEEMAFRSSTITLRHYLADRPADDISVYCEDLAASRSH